jgi:large subunit ribosomal protein L22
MKVTAKAKHIRIAPRKTRLVADLVRGKKAEEAQRILSFTIKKGASPLLKVLNSAIASAKNNFEIEPSNLYIKKIVVDEGPKLKRWRPRSRGMASPIQKKTSHFEIVLEEISETKKTISPKKEKIKVVKKISQEDLKEIKKEEAEDLASKKEKFRPETEKPKPNLQKGIKKIFRRKSV